MLASMPGRTLRYYQHNAARLIPRYEAADVKDLQRQLRATFTVGDRLLELGGGSGREAAFLLGHGYDVIFSDGSAAMLQQAQQVHPELEGRSIIHRCPDALPFPADSIDGVFAVAVLMHMPVQAIQTTLKEVVRVLRPRGLFFFSVPVRRGDVAADGRDDRGRRFTNLSAEQWQAVGEQLGLEVVSSKTNDDGLGRSDVEWLSFTLAFTLSIP